MLGSDTSQTDYPQIVPNQRIMVVPQYCRVKAFIHMSEIRLFWISALHSDCLWMLIKCFERFPCARGISNMPYLSVQAQTNHRVWSLQSTDLHFCSIMCQSASRKRGEVGLISSAARCCHLQSTPWWCAGENKPEFCLLMHWDCSNTESLELL